MDGSYYDWLGIDTSAPVEEVRDAIKCKVLELTELRKRLRLLHEAELEKQVQEMLLTIVRVRETLLDTANRQAYDHSLLFSEGPIVETEEEAGLPIDEPERVEVERSIPAALATGPPEWLEGLEVPVPQEVFPTDQIETLESRAEIPKSPDPPKTAVLHEEGFGEAEEEADEMPEWLKNLESPSPIYPAQTAELTGLGSNSIEAEETPDWLAGQEAAAPAEAEWTFEDPFSQGAGFQEEENELPDWLASPTFSTDRLTHAVEEDEPIDQTLAPEAPYEATPTSSPADDEESSFAQWLAELPPMEIDEIPDWLDTLDKYLSSEAVKPVEIPAVSPPWPAREVMTAPPPSATNSPATPRLPTSSKIDEIKRYGRIEYFTPLDKGHEYPLRVGLLLERHGKRMLEQARIRWTTLRMAACEEEPSMRIVPSSTYLRISPAQRDIKVKKGGDVFADFRILPLQIPETAENKCDLQIDFLFRDEIIQAVKLEVKIQEKFHLGPFQVSHMQWKRFGAIGGAVTVLDTAASLIGFFNPLFSVPASLTLILALAAVGLLVMSIGLGRRAGRRVSRVF